MLFLETNRKHSYKSTQNKNKRNNRRRESLSCWRHGKENGQSAFNKPSKERVCPQDQIECRFQTCRLLRNHTSEDIRTDRADIQGSTRLCIRWCRTYSGALSAALFRTGECLKRCCRFSISVITNTVHERQTRHLVSTCEMVSFPISE